ncbi:ParB/RepB/Spo0J family partition protein [Consotaella salsifontis]|uniref:Chromosome segregation DNA-binding protein n=1 Tax=Consotaella salsifontis TaxID=1365950 RepID=A0A1T4T4U9_9HYPH|nr:ParB/RepB/Spo0J family partition protein [Consotaella salsifontis]SKA35483.1 chromosome segregation DNA-binding protein [Consotaella salsifontis]
MNEDKSRQRLGRGLAALIGPSGAAPRFEAAAAPAGGPDRIVPLNSIHPNPRNPRRTFDPADLADLAASVKSHGIVQPILVRPADGQADRYEIVAGERRYRAARLAGLTEVPVLVRQFTDRQSLEIAIVENVQRADLNAIEEARGYQMLVNEHGYTQADLAEVLGKSRSHVANTLRLLKLPDDVQDMISRGELSAGHARTAVSMEDPAAFARMIVTDGLSVREAERAARNQSGGGEEAPAPAKSRRRAKDVDGAVRAAPPPAASPTPEKDADTAALERLLGETLGMEVAISIDGEGGDIRIAYRSLDELDEICRLLQAYRQDA